MSWKGEQRKLLGIGNGSCRCPSRSSTDIGDHDKLGETETTSSDMQDFAVTKIEDWARSDIYHNSFLIRKDDALEKTLQNSARHGLPDIAVSAAQGKLLNLLASSTGSQRILEVGTLGG